MNQKAGTRVCILDYGSGNVRSVLNRFSSLSDEVLVSNLEQDIVNATHVVLPGVGAFGAAMKQIRKEIPVDQLSDQVVRRGKPFLGICVGMQVLAQRGTEFGDHTGLGWLEATVERMDVHELTLPHIGWNSVQPVRECPLMLELDVSQDFYFVHSYSLVPRVPAIVAATSTYGTQFPAVVHKDNIYGVQFHPEKSQSAGKKLLQNFLRICS